MKKMFGKGRRQSVGLRKGNDDVRMDCMASDVTAILAMQWLNSFIWIGMRL